MSSRAFLNLAFVVLTSCTTYKAKFELVEFTGNAVTTNDFDPIREAIGSHKIVMLGEAIHITHEMPVMRNYLIQNLHEKSGFKNLMFEGSPIEFWIANDIFLSSARDESSIDEFQKTALFGLWQTEEVKSVLKYALQKDEKDGETKLYLSSYDVQIGQGHRFTQGKKVFDTFFERLKKHGILLPKNISRLSANFERLVMCQKKSFPASKNDYESVALDIAQLKNTIQTKLKKNLRSFG